MTTATASPSMSPAVKPGSVTGDSDYQQLMSELFHDLSQPLSTLTCLLEVNLLLSRSLKQLRHDLKVALQQAHTIVRLFRNLRELWEAGEAQQDHQVFSLAGCLREVAADLLPVAEPAKARLFLASGSDCLVNMQAGRLRQALSHVLEFALASAAGSEIEITASEDNQAVRATVTIWSIDERRLKASAAASIAESAERRQHELKRRIGIAVARRIFEGANGGLRIEADGKGLRMDVFLPLASCPQ
jgi:hypothetical protein